jgi:DNA-binding response OmpR family regulator
VIRTAVEQSGCADRIVRAETVESAVELVDGIEEVEAGTDRPTALLLDVCLPDGSGVDVLDRVRRRFDRAELPVVVLSGSDEAVDVDRAYRSGANVYVLEPMRFVEYRHRIARVCRFVAGIDATEDRY